MVDNFLSVLLRWWHGLVKARVREHIERASNNILSDITNILGGEPSSHVHVCEFKSCARVCSVASDHTRWEYSSLNVNITYDNVSHSDSGIHITIFVKRIQHAAWAATIWLLLLLCTDVNAPP
jgi:hypothetical protein